MLRKILIGFALLLPLAGGLAACDDQGPAEEAGEALDKAAEDIGNAFDNSGPMEDAGEKVDDATGN
ncbi:hypothetical protein [Parvibaculum sp.]|uniref:hypothetical protein n=1 Tax=Parvibaculum sp. TaxID=2024848 RepID=UPI00272F94E3|nr:hypothetical protein [Parvibaculum sp.]MDP1626870.1 hypothetical protein [Parvibaculum sp.]MDP2148516.1 hypothetical protein [Parvibaculum sp.]MDP3329315.1 hypothetical protein [Parvibaculum sp.]